MTYHPKFKTKEEAWTAQMYRWRHCGLIGRVSMAKNSMETVIQSPSTTPVAKQLAEQILYLTSTLVHELKTRIDPAP